MLNEISQKLFPESDLLCVSDTWERHPACPRKQICGFPSLEHRFRHRLPSFAATAAGRQVLITHDNHSVFVFGQSDQGSQLLRMAELHTLPLKIFFYLISVFVYVCVCFKGKRF